MVGMSEESGDDSNGVVVAGTGQYRGCGGQKRKVVVVIKVGKRLRTAKIGP